MLNLQQNLSKVLRYGVEITKDIVAELLCNTSDLLIEISLHDEHIKANMLKKWYSFLST